MAILYQPLSLVHRLSINFNHESIIPILEVDLDRYASFEKYFIR